MGEGMVTVMVTQRKKIFGPSSRLLIVLLTMVDAVRRVFEGTRPIDWIILAVEGLVLLVIAWEFYWTVTDRISARKYARGLEQKLTSLTAEERDGLQTILNGGQPKLQVGVSLTMKVYGVVIRAPIGLEIAPEHRAFVTRWLSK
jgi:hypothetical protein